MQEVYAQVYFVFSKAPLPPLWADFL